MENKTQYRKERDFLTIVHKVSKRSHANKRKVGAIIVNDNDKVIAEGHNRQPNNAPTCENENNVTYNSVIHAEEDAIMKAYNIGTVINGSTLYCTYSPCINCCRLIVQSKIKRVVFFEKHETNFDTADSTGIIPQEFLRENNVEVLHMSDFEIEVPTIEKQRYLIYHSGDVDGLMSMYLLQKFNGNYKKLIPYNYADNADWMNLIDNNYKNCVIEFADITPNQEWFNSNYQYFIDNNISFIIYDHHKAQYDKLRIRDDKKIIKWHFHSKYSAANIVFRYLSDVINHKEMIHLDKIVYYVHLYDTWTFKGKREMNDVLFFDIYLKTFLHTPLEFIQEVDYCVKTSSTHMSTCINSGEILSEQIKINNLKMIESAKLYQVPNNINKTKAQRYKSVVLFQGSQKNYWLQEQFVAKYKELDIDLDILVSFNINMDKDIITFSFRSVSEIYDVNVLVRKLSKNGGGHKFAAGMSLPFRGGLEVLEKFNGILNNRM